MDKPVFVRFLVLMKMTSYVADTGTGIPIGKLSFISCAGASCQMCPGAQRSLRKNRVNLSSGDTDGNNNVAEVQTISPTVSRTINYI